MQKGSAKETAIAVKPLHQNYLLQASGCPFAEHLHPPLPSREHLQALCLQTVPSIEFDVLVEGALQTQRHCPQQCFHRVKLRDPGGSSVRVAPAAGLMQKHRSRDRQTQGRE